jgi:hypothetical protein
MGLKIIDKRFSKIVIHIGGYQKKLMVLNYTYFIWKQNYKFEGKSAFN